MADEARKAFEALVAAIGQRDRAAVVAMFAEDAVMVDPHYPKPEMKGHAEIGDGIAWGLNVMESFGFTIVRHFPSADGKSAAFEVDTHHLLKGGRELRFPQVFIVETAGGRISALRAYEPYGPNGMGGFFLGLTRLKRRLFGR